MAGKNPFSIWPVLLLLAVAACPLSGCSSSSAGEDFDVASTQVAGHTHIVRVVIDDLRNQPAAGVTYTSTSSPVPADHSHQITLTRAELATIESGGVVSVASTQGLGHTHSWTIRKP